MRRCVVGIGVDHAHLFHRHPEIIGQQLRDDSVLTLSLQVEADPRRDLPKNIDADAHALGHTNAGHTDGAVGIPVEHARFDGADHTDAEQTACSACAGLFLAQASVIGDLEHFVECRLVIAAVVLVAARNGIGKLLRTEIVP